MQISPYARAQIYGLFDRVWSKDLARRVLASIDGDDVVPLAPHERLTLEALAALIDQEAATERRDEETALRRQIASMGTIIASLWTIDD